MNFAHGDNGGAWSGLVKDVGSFAYTCGYCGSVVTSHSGEGYNYKSSGVLKAKMFICPNCKGPTVFFPAKDTGNQVPGPIYGEPILHLPDDINSLYNEAREAHKNNCFTASVMLCRKILMNIAVAEGADENKRFIEYVDYLRDNHLVTIKSHGWVDIIRQKGNEANHEIRIMDREESEQLLAFIAMILKTTYEFPKMLPNPDTSTT